MRKRTIAVLAATAMGVVTAAGAVPAQPASTTAAAQPQWSEIVENAPWSARAGLQAVTLGKKVYVLGGRVPNPPPPPPATPIPGDSELLNDVWLSKDRGKKWSRVKRSGKIWKPRAYFAAVPKGKYMYVLGGQDFRVQQVPCPPPEIAPDCPPFASSSRFFNDVWRSKDGRKWQRMTRKAPWAERAGLSAVALKGDLYVFGGSRNDDQSIIGGPPVREYFRDVWKSSNNGRTWKRMTGKPGWSKRAGAATAVTGGSMYLLGGEVGFTCPPDQPDCKSPYFNDVWRSTNGKKWKRMTGSAGWSPRPGHKCEVLGNRIICFGGFGLPANPTDVWSSTNGRKWKQLPGTAWNAAGPDEIKYDFDTTVVGTGGKAAIYTFGGDRETFDFADPENYLRVDNDVWRLRLTG